MLQRNNLQKRRLSPLTISNKRSGNNVSGKGVITPRHENSIVLYFNEINGRDCDPILKDSEKELFEAYWAGEKAKVLIKQSKDKDKPQPTEETYTAVKDGEIAKDILIKSNLRFVVSVAKHYQNQGLPFEDLVSEGNYGLLTALKKFDPEREIKFLSYAVWWIRQSILQALVDVGKMVRIPINKKDSLQRVNKRIAALEQELQRQPTVDEIVDSITDMGGDMDAADVGNILRSNLTQLSLDAPIKNSTGDEDGTMMDLMPSPEYYNSTKSEDIVSEVKNILSKLDEKERNIVEMYYGVLRDRKYTLEEIGEIITPKLTRERVRQIKEKAIKKLRYHPKVLELLEYVIED